MRKSILGLLISGGVAGSLILRAELSAEDRFDARQVKSNASVLVSPSYSQIIVANERGSQPTDVAAAVSRIDLLEQQVVNLTETVNEQAAYLLALQETILVDNQGQMALNATNLEINAVDVEINAIADISLHSSKTKIQSSAVQVDAPQCDVAGTVTCEVVQTDFVVSDSYTPGTGNLW